jgi:hypothetical protein
MRSRSHRRRFASEILRNVQRIKERVGVTIEIARPVDFVPPLDGSDGRHVFIESIDTVTCRRSSKR